MHFMAMGEKKTLIKVQVQWCFNAETNYSLMSLDVHPRNVLSSPVAGMTIICIDVNLEKVF